MLLTPCKYSFQDLINAAGPDANMSTHNLYSMTQYNRNNEVKKLCKLSGWFYQDVEKKEGKNNIIYTAFSPHLVPTVFFFY